MSRLSVLGGLLAAPLALTQSVFDGVIRPAGDGSYYAYLPPPNISNHASFIELDGHGGLITAWFTGEGEGSAGTSVTYSSLGAGSAVWGAATVFPTNDELSCQNPVLWHDRHSRTMYLWHTCQPAATPPVENEAQLWWTSSDNGGQSWQPVSLFWTAPGIFDRNRVFVHDNGDVTLPSYNASGNASENYSVRLTGTPELDGWTEVAWPGTNYLVQPSMVRLLNGTVVVFFRDRGERSIYRAVSSDDGLSLDGTPQPTVLPNNNAAVEAILLSSGAIAIVFDNCTKGRSPLMIALSYDGGITWPYQRVLQDHDDNSTAPATNTTEYSYPSLVQTPDGQIHVTYSYNRWCIKYRRFDEDWVKGHRDGDDGGQGDSQDSLESPTRVGSVATVLERAVSRMLTSASGRGGLRAKNSN